MSKRATHFPVLEERIRELQSIEISEERKAVLQLFIDYVQDKVAKDQEIRVNFICTHNSRRSHLSQVWAQTMAAYFGLRNIQCYSGGTEATALFSKVAETLAISGFAVQPISQGANPVYAIKYGASAVPIIGFSKTFDAVFNPSAAFAAVMTCSHADNNCPYIPGAEKRIPITYEDPKVFDNTEQQSQKYAERSRQIATEMYHVFSQIALR